MAKYRQRDSSTWTLSSTALGWGSAVVVSALVVVFAAGIYFGYGWGYEQGREIAESERPDIPEHLARFRTDARGFDTPPEEAENDYPDYDEDQAYTAEDLGFFDELDEDPPAPERVQEIPDEPEETPERAEVPSPVDRTPTAEPVEDEEPDQPEEERALQTFYVIQAASSQNRENAESAAEELRQAGHTTTIREAMVGNNRWYRVRVGEFPSRREAADYAEEMKDDGQISDYWISQVEQ